MLKLPELGPYATLLLIAAIAAVISYGVTQGLKMIVLWWDKTHHDEWWFNIVIRTVAVLAGAGVGYVLLPGMVGLGVGAAAGVMNTTLVAIIKSRLAGLEPPAGAEQEIQQVQNVVDGAEKVVGEVKDIVGKK